LKSTDHIRRPLLDVPKADILEYAITNKLKWREDPTNHKDIYTRNYIRHHLIPRLGEDGRQKLIDIINESADRNADLDAKLTQTLEQLTERGKLKRLPFIQLTHAVAKEVMHAWLRQHGVKDVDSKMLERLVHAAKTFHPVKHAPAGGNIDMQVGKEFLALLRIER
jgi:tRNA(Ile)-lysidine synthase